ncbi:MAG: histidinol-phosphate aminotransferase [Saprospiraceae bacterium]|jgi:histidinol-phosphate aminotransferase
MNISDFVRPNIISLKPFSSARAEFTGSAEVFLDANENPNESNHNRYPDPHHNQVREALSLQKNVDKSSILLGNGSDEIIDMIIRTFCEPGKDILRSISPTFGMYEVGAAINDVTLEKVALLDDFGLDVAACLEGQTEKHKVLFLCSPNNPTGNSLAEEKLVEVIKLWKGIVVVDEAYIDFSDKNSLINRLSEFSNLIILQTFSKAWAAAGLRIGMCFANTEIIGFLNKVKPPYNLGSHTQKEALEILNNSVVQSEQILVIKEERDRLVVFLNEVSGVEKIFPSDANFLLIRLKYHLELKDFLETRGIIVRDRSKLPGCEECLRITVGLHRENARLIAAINEFYALKNK